MVQPLDTHKAFLKRKGIEMVSYSAAAANAAAMLATSTRFAKSDMTDYEYLQATTAAKFEKQCALLNLDQREVQQPPQPTPSPPRVRLHTSSNNCDTTLYCAISNLNLIELIQY